MQMSIGQVFGIPTAGDRRRAAERAALRRGMKRGRAEGLEKGAEQERKKNESVNAQKIKFLRAHNVSEELIAAMELIK